MAAADNRRRPRPANKRFQKTDSLLKFAEEVKKDEEVVLREFFDICDVNHDGTITFAELKKVMKDLCVNTSNDELEELFRKLDVNKDGEVSFQEFRVGISSW